MEKISEKSARLIPRADVSQGARVKHPKETALLCTVCDMHKEDECEAICYKAESEM